MSSSGFRPLVQPWAGLSTPGIVRYVKLTVGVLCAILGIAATVFAVVDALAYVSQCPDDGVADRYFCSMGLRETLMLLAVAVTLDLGAFFALRYRERPWTVRRSPSVE